MRQNTPEAFQSSLREGQYAELRVALFLMLRHWNVRIAFSPVSGYDVFAVKDGQLRRVEVKWDRRAGDTGNLYFEVRNTRQDRPSGIMATPASTWCHIIGAGDRALLASTAELRELLAGGQWRKVRTSGADSNSEGLVVPLDALAQLRWVTLPTVEDFFGEVFRAGTAGV